MRPDDTPTDLFTAWESAVAFRLFADLDEPTLTVPEQIAAHLGERILSGLMPPGTRIGEQELATEFNVSRGPIRDALRILEREGLATLLARRGAIVTSLTTQELRELLEIRAGLFELVVRKLIAAPTAQTLALLKTGVARLDNLAQRPAGGDEYAETTYRLLLLLARQCDNKRLQRMLTALSLQTLRYSKLGLASMDRRKRSAQLWNDALMAYEQGDVERMVTLTRLRIEESGEEAISVLKTPSAQGVQ